MWDLIWSVGGSPPYGDVPYDEAAAVYELVEDYRGPGMASPACYQAVESFCADDEERANALEAFRINDQITSDPDGFTADAVAAGAELAEKADYDGLRCLFMLYEAEILMRQQDIEAARDKTLAALRLGLQLASDDDAYATRVAQAAQNAISLTQLSGDTEGAERLREQLSGVLNEGLIWEGAYR
ncbi:MAG: hypothetical protein ACWGPN_13675 [Gammaproteobacteria bacterium]